MSPQNSNSGYEHRDREPTGLFIVRVTHIQVDYQLSSDPGMKITSFSAASIILISATILAGCDSSSNDVPEPKFRVQFSFDGLGSLQNGFHYQSWLQIGSTFEPTEIFNLDDEGRFVNNNGQFIASTFFVESDISEASLVMVTIEGKRDIDEEPSSTVVLAGPVTASIAILTTSDPNAVGVDFSSSAGVFTLMTPSDDPAGNETQGVWFVDPTLTSGFVAGLSLPTPPSGWIYEGWVGVGNEILSTGQFNRMQGVDLGQPYSLQDALNFPGEDFFVNPPAGVSFPLDLSGADVFVTLEPFPDDSPEVFPFRLLEGKVPLTLSTRQAHALAGSQAVPSGTATLLK
jgi:hypothetical protein